MILSLIRSKGSLSVQASVRLRRTKAFTDFVLATSLHESSQYDDSETHASGTWLDPFAGRLCNGHIAQIRRVESWSVLFRVRANSRHIKPYVKFSLIRLTDNTFSGSFHQS